MRKAYKKARWKRMANRVRKRGGEVFFVCKKTKQVGIPYYPFTFEGILQFLSDLGYEYSEVYSNERPSEEH